MKSDLFTNLPVTFATVSNGTTHLIFCSLIVNFVIVKIGTQPV